MSDAILRNWDKGNVARWGKEPLLIEHGLHENPLFTRQALAELIQRFPKEHYALVHTGNRGDAKRTWREGEVGDLNGQEVIEAIGAGRMWLNLRNVKTVDQRYGELLDAIFEEMARRVPRFDTFNRGMGILISSPNAQVYYHADLPGQSLWQISGRKRVYLYPAAEPYLPQAELEKIALFGVEVDMRYDPLYDRDALVFDLEPGQMLTWPLNAPHRVENYDVLNISVTTEHWTDEIRRSQMVTVANGILRQHFGIQPGGRSLHGPVFLAKAALQAGWRRSPWMKRERRKRRPIDFRLARGAPGTIIDIPAYVVR
ncbi:hypothetical protein OSH11_14755 [Kaistia dalseonensis]|uniref:JmjC domain-containing protein n=1 Tax=Kaistia dalseonensis TaxID=410840 RepID=A0ABU0H8C9_9HYPH|nr:hypothetical protein [Kaistia dalseonensis]MCX5495971.1 hypothetical protein [Kaistia dalseonensis]MDQ0438574.1 hypothetical protein [Kaistia dalseonensis]